MSWPYIREECISAWCYSSLNSLLFQNMQRDNWIILTRVLKTQKTNLQICTVFPEPLLLVCTKYGNNIRPRLIYDL